MMTSASDHLEVADAIEALPADLRAELAKGPLEEPRCRICRTLGQQPEVTEAEEAILEFHDMGGDQLAESMFGALGTDRRLSAHELAAAAAYERQLERMPESNIKRRAVESLCEAVMWWRCLYVYTIAGWRP